MKGFEIVKRLNELVEKSTVPEPNVGLQVEHLRIQNLKTRLNYLVTLGILRQPEAVYHGRGKGGTRLFQRDVLDVLNFVHELMDNFTLNEIAGIVREKREDLIRKAFKELQIDEHIPESPVLLRAVTGEANLKCLFSYDLLRGSLASLKIVRISEISAKIEVKIEALGEVQREAGSALGKECQKEISKYIREQRKQQKDLTKILEDALIVGKNIIEIIEAGDQ